MVDQKAYKAAWQRRKYRRDRGLPEDAVIQVRLTPEERKEKDRAKGKARYRAKLGLPPDAELPKRSKAKSVAPKSEQRISEPRKAAPAPVWKPGRILARCGGIL